MKDGNYEMEEDNWKNYGCKKNVKKDGILHITECIFLLD